MQLRASTTTWAGPAARARGRARTEPRLARGTMAGQRLGVYELKGLLGEGGMARVYLAEHTAIERLVAIKRLLPELGHLPAAHALFLREARIAGAIRHPNLLEVFDFGYDPDGRPYFVMELALGDTLAQRLAHGPLLTSQALDVAIALTEAIAAVHRAGYLHRDVKADNVMLARIDRRVVPKLIDFGIARRLDGAAGDAGDATEGVAGTPRVMAPEQVARDRVDERTDLWGLGVLLYEMITGHLPFDPRASARDDMLAVVTDAPRPLPDDVHPGVRAIIGACLRKDPDERPASAPALVEQLRVVQGAYLAARGMIARGRGRATGG
ncbi:MAG: serine/threonine protein kinase [Kofleriaceae bacterium]|nr:serine/threonine protein kinase [Kofleriaceae bacterium]MCB9574451.1 serine/threonine protein kinase [Kofleriaceae bacterium]